MNTEHELMIDNLTNIINTRKYHGRHRDIKKEWTRVKLGLIMPLIIENEALKRPWYKRIWRGK
jgi:aspartyl/asparaginyl beta-hydroxylase (cupin superfamily)